MIISDWQAANQLNPYFSNAFANSQVYRGDDADAAGRVAADGHWKPRPVGRGRSPTRTTSQDDTDGTGFTVDIKIQPNLKWSDGQPFTLNDIKLHLRRRPRQGAGRHHDPGLG